MQGKVFTGATLGKDIQVLSSMQGGTVDFASMTTNLLVGIAKDAGLVDLPYLFASEQEAFTVLDGPVGQKIHAELEPRGLLGLSYFDMGYYSLHNNKLAATVIFYGSSETDPAVLKNLPGPVLGIFGGADQSIPVEEVKAFEAGLVQAGIRAADRGPGRVDGAATLAQERARPDREGAAVLVPLLRRLEVPGLEERPGDPQVPAQTLHVLRGEVGPQEPAAVRAPRAVDLPGDLPPKGVDDPVDLPVRPVGLLQEPAEAPVLALPLLRQPRHEGQVGHQLHGAPLPCGNTTDWNRR